MDFNMDQHADDPKKTAGPLFCCILFNAVLGYFFGLYWLNNPDVYPTTLFNTVDLPLNSTYDIYAGSTASFECYSSTNGTEQFWALTWPFESNFIIVGKVLAKNGTVVEQWPKLTEFSSNDNVTANFLMWFSWGFILQMIAIASSIIGCIGAGLKNSVILKGTSGLMGCV